MKSRLALGIISFFVGAWLVLPTLVVIPLSFTNKSSFNFPPSEWSFKFYRQLASSEVWRSAIVNSFSLALATACIATTLGILAAVSLVRVRPQWFATAFYGFFVLPLIFPIIVLAIALYIVFLRFGLTGTYIGFLLAHIVLALPFPIITVSTGLRSIDPNLARAAGSLGATPVRTFISITAPLILPSILSGAIYAFMISFDEVVVGLFIQNASFRTLPVQMYISATAETDPKIASAATILIFISAIALLCLQLTSMIRKKGI